LTAPAANSARLRLWIQKWRWYERNSLPWNRARIHWELMRREAFARWPLHGNVLEMLHEGRLEVGTGTLFEPGVWLTGPAPAHIRIGGGSFLNLGVMIAAAELVEIGEHCMLANGCFVTTPTTASTIRRSRCPGRASRVRGRLAWGTTSGAEPMWSSRAGSLSASAA
jgi:hypothetical protein